MKAVCWFAVSAFSNSIGGLAKLYCGGVGFMEEHSLTSL